jgi:hypothetical protein
MGLVDIWTGRATVLGISSQPTWQAGRRAGRQREEKTMHAMPRRYFGNGWRRDHRPATPRVQYTAAFDADTGCCRAPVACGCPEPACCCSPAPGFQRLKRVMRPKAAFQDLVK